MDENTLARVEEQRLQLESNIATLRKGLRHWQTLEIDYEGLREEFLGLPDSASPEQCLNAAKEFGPELVDEGELQALLTDKSRGHKTPPQLVDLFAKRAEYVLRNIATIRKQLSDAEKKRNALLLVEKPEYQDDAGLPLKEITEELDEDGEVISSHVQAPGADTSKLINVLRKAGVTDLEDDKKSSTMNVNLIQQDSEIDDNNLPATETKDMLVTARLDNNDKTPVEDDDSDDEDDQDEMLGPTNPNDTEEDAALRQEMLQYGLGEVGAIVAELDLAEDGSDMSFDDLDEDENEEFSDYDDEEASEDERGASKVPVISDRYKKKMEALQERLGIQNLGPESPLSEETKEQMNRPPAAEAARKAALARAEKLPSNLKQENDDKTTKPTKKVAFAEGLDIADESTVDESKPPNINPVGEVVRERSDMDTNTDFAAAIVPTKKMSKFKASRLANSSVPIFPPPMEPPAPTKSTPQGPTGKITADQLIERSPSASNPPDSSEFDEQLHRHEVAAEFQKFRNRKIHAQGGYVQGGEQDNYGEEYAPLPVEDEITGKPRKVSRFKAARMKP